MVCQFSDPPQGIAIDLTLGIEVEAGGDELIQARF
jgi:hypothetical protein